jgi:hypothetical protein
MWYGPFLTAVANAAHLLWGGTNDTIDGMDEELGVRNFVSIFMAGVGG